MALVINNNRMAAQAAKSLSNAYGKLSSSINRLSSGLRVNSAADDAAGLAIREMMRSDVQTLNQGVRNANDAVSLIQTADGALQVIDEKLIRMKELSEQAATGTYNSVQRLVIDSEFQAMASEINRIANATEFNGIKLLDGSLAGVKDFEIGDIPELDKVRDYLFGGEIPDDIDDYTTTVSYEELIKLYGGYSKLHDGSKHDSEGALKVHFGTGNDSAEDYYYVDIGAATTDALLGSYEIGYHVTRPPTIDWAGAIVEGNKITFNITNQLAGQSGSPPGVGADMPGMDFYALPVGLKNVTIRSKGYPTAFHKPDVNLFTKDGTQLTGADPGGLGPGGIPGGNNWWGKTQAQVIQAGIDHGLFDPGATYTNNINTAPGAVITAGGSTITQVTGQSNNAPASWEETRIDEVTSDLVFLIGGHANGNCNRYDLEITAELSPPKEQVTLNAVDNQIETQEKAQKMLAKLDDAIVKKETIRAHLGALQNRLENTVVNLKTQSENLLSAESRISDVDVASEMIKLVRSQVLAQVGTSVLAQSNTLPQLALKLMG